MLHFCKNINVHLYSIDIKDEKMFLFVTENLKPGKTKNAIGKKNKWKLRRYLCNISTMFHIFIDDMETDFTHNHSVDDINFYYINDDFFFK